MRTKIQAIKEKHTDILKDLYDLMGTTHTQDDFGKYIKSLGGEIEKFLKDAVYNNTQNNNNFKQLIDNLSNHNISNSSRTNFQELRKLYNKFKHDQSFQTDIQNCIKKVENSLTTIKEIETKNIGAIRANYYEQNNRILWITGWDDYRGGMTEVGLFLPNYNSSFPKAIEHFNIDFRGWDLIKNKFIPTGELEMGKKYVSSKAYKLWENEPDFLGAGSFSGDIKELVKVLASQIDNKKEEKLLDFLKRKTDSSSVRTAIIFSLFDCFVDDQWKNLADLKDEIYIRASYDYGIKIESKLIEKYLENINQEVESADRSIFQNVKEILWLNGKNYKKEVVEIGLIKNNQVAINDDKQLITKV